MADKPNWEMLNEVQLKGSLVRRGLSTAGTKEEMISRLRQYDMDESPMLMKNRMMYGYYVTKAIRTVLITPFTKELMSKPGFTACLEQALSFQIHKTKSGTSAVKLLFKNVDVGDSMYFKLKKELSSLDVTVLHPANPANRTQQRDEINHIFKGTESYGDRLIKRTVILEKLPSSINKEEKLTELFPEAVDAVSFQFESTNNGIAILEFGTEKEVDDFITTTGNEVELEGETVIVTKFNTRNKEFTRVYAEKKKTSEETVSLEDDDRIAMVEEILGLDRELLDLEESQDYTGKEKVSKVCQLNELKRNKQQTLTTDTKRRLAAKEFTMPEGEEKMSQSTAQIIAKAKELAASKENGTAPSSITPKKKTQTKTKSDASVSTVTKDILKMKISDKSPASKANTASPKKKPNKVVSMKGVGGKPRPSTAPGRGQSRGQAGGYPRNVQSGRPGLLPDQRQALVRGRGMNRNMQQGMPGSWNQLGYNSRDGQQHYQQQMMNRQYEDAGQSQASAQMIVEGLTSVLTEKVRELEQIHHNQQQSMGGQQQGGHGNQFYDGGFDGGRMNQDRMALHQFYQGGYNDQSSSMGGYDYPPNNTRYQQQQGNMRGIYEENRAPYSNFRGRGVHINRGANTYNNGGGYGRGGNW